MRVFLFHVLKISTWSARPLYCSSFQLLTFSKVCESLRSFHFLYRFVSTVAGTVKTEGYQKIYSVEAQQLLFMENNIKSELIYRETLWVQVFIRKYINAAQCLGSLFVRRSNLSFYKNVLKIDFWHRESWDYFS